MCVCVCVCVPYYSVVEIYEVEGRCVRNVSS